MSAQYEHVAVATDFSAASAVALRHAVRLARRDGARVSIVYVVGGYVPEAEWPSIWSIPQEQAEQRLRDVLHDELDSLVASADAPDVNVETVLVFGDPAEHAFANAANALAEHLQAAEARAALHP